LSCRFFINGQFAAASSLSASRDETQPVAVIRIREMERRRMTDRSDMAGVFFT
jgi:hypothetical protein